MFQVNKCALAKVHEAAKVARKIVAPVHKAIEAHKATAEYSIMKIK